MTDQDTNFEQKNKRLLIELLQSIDRPGDYCVGGNLHVPMPKITLKNVGTLSFPVPQAQIDALIEMAERAPYGKGTKTLMDTSVRDCWQIDARQIRITGKAWKDSFRQIMNLVSEGLGLNQGQLDAKLYKLLVYKEDGFFAAHRDTEKVPGMIATLSLSLPTPGEGGELSIRHAGQETVFNMNVQEPSELSYAAFYADCLHEARPVTKGHRISLVYNLFICSGKKWTGAPDYTGLTEKVRECLIDWMSSSRAEKMVWMLDHSYSEEGLSFETLKGTDAAVARVLGDAADHAGCDMHAAVLYIQETGDPEITYSGDYWEEPTIGSTIERLTEREEYLENWTARDGSHPPFGEISLHDGELFPIDSVDGMEPDEELLEEYMGNYGPTLDLIYRFAALVVWPQTNTLKIVASDGIGHAVSWVATQHNLVSNTEMQNLLLQLANLWPESRVRYIDDNRSVMLELLSKTGNANIAVDFLDRTTLVHYDGSENEQLAGLMPLVGPRAAKEFLLKLVKQYMPTHPKEILSFLAMIAKNLGQDDPVWRNAERDAAQSAMSLLRTVLERISEALSKASYQESKYITRKIDEQLSLDSAAIRNLFALTWHLGMARESSIAATTLADFPKVATPDRMLPEALAELYKIERVSSTEAYRLLWRQSVDILIQRSSAPPEEPSNWTIDADIPCTSDLRAELQAFCLKPGRRTRSFRVAKDSRRHIRQTIDRFNLDINYVTIRKGRPYTLKCTKNRNGHKRRLVEYSEDIRYIERMLALVPENTAENADVTRIKRLETAVEAFPD